MMQVNRLRKVGDTGLGGGLQDGVAMARCTQHRLRTHQIGAIGGIVLLESIEESG